MRITFCILSLIMLTCTRKVIEDVKIHEKKYGPDSALKSSANTQFGQTDTVIKDYTDDVIRKFLASNIAKNKFIPHVFEFDTIENHEFMDTTDKIVLDTFRLMDNSLQGYTMTENPEDFLHYSKIREAVIKNPHKPYRLPYGHGHGNYWMYEIDFGPNTILLEKDGRLAYLDIRETGEQFISPDIYIGMSSQMLLKILHAQKFTKNKISNIYIQTGSYPYVFFDLAGGKLVRMGYSSMPD